MSTFEAIGSLIKEENLFSIQDQSIRHTLVLESQDPFPGYHHDTPVESIPRSVFLATSQLYDRETVTRTRKNILKYADFDFDAASAEIFIHNDIYPCLRIKQLNHYDQIAILQQHFLNEGLTFKRFENIHSKAIIKVKKTFFLHELESGVYGDQLEPYQGYFDIPKNISWKLFEKITQNIRNNWEGRHFDAALGFFYKKFDVHDMVRIYHQSSDPSILINLKSLYLKELANY